MKAIESEKVEQEQMYHDEMEVRAKLICRLEESLQEHSERLKKRDEEIRDLGDEIHRIRLLLQSEKDQASHALNAKEEIICSLETELDVLNQELERALEEASKEMRDISTERDRMQQILEEREMEMSQLQEGLHVQLKVFTSIRVFICSFEENYLLFVL